MFQVFMASTDAWSTGPESHRPLPCTQANSLLDRETPSRRYGLPAAVTSWLPETFSAGAGPAGGKDVDGEADGDAEMEGDVDGDVDGETEGDADVGGGLLTEPVQATPLSSNAAGTG